MIKINKAHQPKLVDALYCDRGGLRTPNPQSRNLIFYPVELRGLLQYKITNLYNNLYYAKSFFTIVDIVLPSACPARFLEAKPIT